MPLLLNKSIHSLYLLRVWLIAIPLACSRLRRSPDVLYLVEQARSACSTKYNKLLARRSRASTRRERAKAQKIRHALSVLATGPLYRVGGDPFARLECVEQRGLPHQL